MASTETAPSDAGSNVVPSSSTDSVDLNEQTSQDGLVASGSGSSTSLIGRRTPRKRSQRMSTVTDFVYRTVELQRDAGAELGMDIVVEDTGVLVTAVVPGSLVGTDGSIGPGDWLLEVNSEPLAGKPEVEVVRILREITGKVVLRAACRVYRDDFVLSGKAPQMLTEYVAEEVEITPNADGFGLDIATTPEEGTVVTAVVAGGPADESGVFRVGDMIASLNGESLAGLAADAVLEKFRNAKSGPARFTLIGRNVGHPRYRKTIAGVSDADAPVEQQAGWGCVIF